MKRSKYVVAIADAGGMHVKKLIIITGVFLLGVLGLSLSLLGAESKESKQAKAKDQEVQLIEENPPKYLAFKPTLKSGVSYKVADSNRTEFESEDEDYQIEPKVLSFSEDEETDSDEEADRLEETEPVEVEGSISPGIYVTDFGVDCEIELWRVMNDNQEAMIASDRIDSGRMIVNINAIEPDRFYSSAGCGQWSEWSALEEPLVEADNGDYWSNDLKTGTWQVPKGCVWERVVDFRGGLIWDTKQSGTGPGELVISEDDLGIRLRGCQDPIEHTTDTVNSLLAYVDVEEVRQDAEIGAYTTTRSRRR